MFDYFSLGTAIYIYKNAVYPYHRGSSGSVESKVVTGLLETATLVLSAMIHYVYVTSMCRTSTGGSANHITSVPDFSHYFIRGLKQNCLKIL